mgnify:CR=1 FL=1
MALTVAEEIKRLTSDPGARRLGEHVDSLLTRVKTLEEKVAACCAPNPNPVAGPSPSTPEPPPAEPPTG